MARLHRRRGRIVVHLRPAGGDDTAGRFGVTAHRLALEVRRGVDEGGSDRHREAFISWFGFGAISSFSHGASSVPILGSYTRDALAVPGQERRVAHEVDLGLRRTLLVLVENLDDPRLDLIGDPAGHEVLERTPLLARVRVLCLDLGVLTEHRSSYKDAFHQHVPEQGVVATDGDCHDIRVLTTALMQRLCR
ncbi:hypothetical protein AB0M97_16055 [Streptomyces sp. NPDC051207]|uniref:hypothetical protein n=1 Tax=Streptomyces sp. NPDC051207 TaxID=3154641 RepID=UPI0034196F95